jgi:hypothetical protein
MVSQQGDKGLRHFSMKVCEKVEQKVRTTYNEVADELVAEFGHYQSLPTAPCYAHQMLRGSELIRDISPAVAATEMVSAVDQAYDEKNIRR